MLLSFPAFIKTFPLWSGVPSRSFSSVRTTAWKGALAAQLQDVQGLDCSSPADSVLGPLYLAHSVVGETSPSLWCHSQIGPQCFPVTTCWHFEGLLPPCPSLSATSSGADTEIPGRSVAGGGGQPHTHVWDSWFHAKCCPWVLGIG